MPQKKVQKNTPKKSKIKKRKPHKIDPPKLSLEQQNEVAALAAVGYNAPNIREFIKEKYQITLNRVTLHKNYFKNKNWKAKIAKLREIADERLAKHALYPKVHRLDILLRAINEALEWRDDKLYFYEGEEAGRIKKRNVCLIAPLMREVRAEINPDGPLIDNSKKEYYIKILHELAKDKDVPGNDRLSAASHLKGGLSIVK